MQETLSRCKCFNEVKVDGTEAAGLAAPARGESSMVSRRAFLRRSAGTLGAMLAVPAATPGSNAQATTELVQGRLPDGLYVGLELPSQNPMPACVMEGLSDIGLNYANFYTASSVGDYVTAEQISEAAQQAVAKAMVEQCEQAGFHFSPAVHWKEIPESTLAFYGENPFCQDVVMDEGEHVRQLNWRPYGAKFGIEPWAKVDGLSLPEAYARTLDGLRRTREHYRRLGLDTVITCVWPVMFHTIARAGCGVCAKVMGMSYSPVAVAIALGAAQQYQTKFWIDLEMWSQGSGDALPGHSPEEFRSNLLLAYGMGVDHIYVEGAGWNSLPAGAQGVPWNLVSYHSQQRFRLTEYGKILRWFCREYVPAHPRSYTFREVTPEIVIVRFPDTCWGQRYSSWPDHLYGADNLHSDATTEAWLKIWDLLTHGFTGSDGITYEKRRIAMQLKPTNTDYSPVPENVAIHPFFTPLNNVVVYDHLVGESLLGTARLIFLTGISVSSDTLQAIAERVREGAVCVALRSLAGTLFPEKSAGGTTTTLSGQGKWVITDDFGDPAVRAQIEPFLGNPQEIRYRFGKHELRLRAVEGDLNCIRVEV